MLDCEALFQSIRRDMVHGARRYGAGGTYDAIRNSIETFRECQKDLASYLAIELDFAFSKLSARNAVEQCDALLFDPGTTAKVRWYCLYLKARLLIDVIPYTENEALRFEALSLAETNGFRVLAAVTKVNWVLAALSKADAHTASLKLNEARSAVANLSHQELEDPDAFGIKARLKAHEAKVLIHVVEETESPPANTVELVNNIYNEVCKNIE